MPVCVIQLSTQGSCGCTGSQGELIQADSRGGPGLSPRPPVLWQSTARAAATGQGHSASWCQTSLVSQAHSHVCHGGRLGGDTRILQGHQLLTALKVLATQLSPSMPESQLHFQSQMSCLSSWDLCQRTDTDRAFD